MAIYSVPPVHPGHEYERAKFSNVYTATEDLTSLTGTTLVTVWAPGGSVKFKLKGYSLTAVVRTTFAAANPRMLAFWDGSTSAMVCPAKMTFQATEPVGVWYASSEDLKEGFLSATAGNALKLGFSGTISTGVLSISCLVWGEETT